jgi:hypothetical protein
LRRDVKFQGGRTKPTYLSLKFAGKDRELGLNTTNRKTLAALFGVDGSRNNAVHWFGKRILLFVEQDVRRPDGTTGPAVRIRAKRIKQDASPAAAPAEVVAADGASEANNSATDAKRDPGADG